MEVSSPCQLHVSRGERLQNSFFFLMYVTRRIFMSSHYPHMWLWLIIFTHLLLLCRGCFNLCQPEASEGSAPCVPPSPPWQPLSLIKAGCNWCESRGLIIPGLDTTPQQNLSPLVSGWLLTIWMNRCSTSASQFFHQGLLIEFFFLQIWNFIPSAHQTTHQD